MNSLRRKAAIPESEVGKCMCESSYAHSRILTRVLYFMELMNHRVGVMTIEYIASEIYIVPVGD